MRFLGIVLMAGLLMQGCASTERFQRDMDSYLGWGIDRLREHFGYSYIEHDLGGERRAYTWTWSERGMLPGHQTPDVIHTYQSKQGTAHTVFIPGNYFPAQYYEYACEFSFIFDSQDRVVSWRAQGNGCVSYPGPAPVLRHQAEPHVQP